MILLLYMSVCLLQFLLHPPVTIPLQTMGGLMPDAMASAPPEVKKGGWSVLKEYDFSYLHSLLSNAHTVSQYQLQTDTPSACFSTLSSILPNLHPRLPSRPIHHLKSPPEVPYPRPSFTPSKNSSTRTLNYECHPRTSLMSEWQNPVEKDMDFLYIIDSSRFVPD